MPRLTAALALCSVALLSGCAAQSQGIDVSADWPDFGQTATPTPDPSAAAARPAGELPADPTMLIFGDSWTNGLAATSTDKRYATLTGEILGWPTTVDGENGSGYLSPGSDGEVYGTRVLSLPADLDPDVIVVQGSINDRDKKLYKYEKAAIAVWNALEAKYPDAEIIVLGPAPQVLPVQDATAELDEMLDEAAAQEGLTYISPIQDDWITEDNYDTVIDQSADAALHPSDAGHAYLAEKLADELERLVPAA